ncbi:MAG: alpha-amylase [Lachnospiraceae bacterium]|nr:alpha-amylase [Lachnospiraceae bacterium]
MEKRLQQFYDYVSAMDTTEVLYIPRVWNQYVGCPEQVTQTHNVVAVNQGEFYRTLLAKIIEKKDGMDLDVRHSRIYCAMPRYTMAWDLKQDGTIRGGTLVRMLILLPMLKEMKINVLYLLPITEYSTRNQKGDMGSPFAIKDFYRLDPNLHDALVDGMENFDLNDEFHLLVEAAHLLGIRIVIDFIPRVTARDSNLLMEHPEWFYWIDKSYEEQFRTPEIPGLDFFEECTVENIRQVYEAESTKAHLAHFCQPPNKQNPKRWEKLVAKAKQTGANILPLIEENFGITTPPAHSDWINDVQPIWTDITFWKLYLDNNPWATRYTRADQAPYVMFDTIKTNKFPAKVPNQELWDLFEEVLTYYATEFGLDGFRFDIGHTLPPQLLQRLFETVRKHVDHPIFISEDLFNRNHKSAKQTGYNIMLGSSWNEVSHITKETYENFVEELSGMEIMAYACAETHDTPRIVTRKGGKQLAKSLAIVNNFLPNGAHFMLAGYEINEPQPMNCGLADNTGGAPIKKAFFNEMTMNWTSDDAADMISYLVEVNGLRCQLEDKVQVSDFHMLEEDGATVAFGYSDDVVILFNTDMEQESLVPLPSDVYGDYRVAAVSYRLDTPWKAEEQLRLPNGGAVVLCKE